MASTGAGTKTSRACKQCKNEMRIYLGLPSFFLMMNVLLGCNVDVGFSFFLDQMMLI